VIYKALYKKVSPAMEEVSRNAFQDSLDGKP
jgi:hypothetical protein